ncbi:MAG: bacillithiol biosynthesis deacetylase BshB1 [Cyclobacteriaceae bacterium]
MKLDLLVLASHPDDAELGCGATIAKQVAMGRQVGIVDFTRGELGTRGTPETRDQEAAASAQILGIAARENLRFRDGFFENDEKHRLALVQVIRKFRPDIVIANAVYDRHPDHGRAAGLSYEALFLSGLPKIETTDKGVAQRPWRPRLLFHYIQSQMIQPDFIVDVSSHWDKKMQAVRAYKSQFFDPNSNEPETYISSPLFMNMLEARGAELGHAIGARYGEGFTARRTLGVDDPFTLL